MADFCLQFDGLTGYVETDQALQTVIRSGTFGITIKCKPTDGQKAGGQALWGNWGINHISLVINENGILTGHVTIGTNTISVTEDLPTFSDGIQPWKMISLVGVTTEGPYGKLLLYVNNVLRKTGSEGLIGWSSYTSGQGIELGDNGDEIYFAGLMDDFRIYPISLSAGNITAIWNNSIGTKYTGAVAEGGVAVYALNMDDYDPANPAITYDTINNSEAALSNGVSWLAGSAPFNPYGIVTLTDVKSRLGLTTVDNDIILERIITGVEAIFNKYTMRTLIAPAEAVTEYYAGASCYLQLNSYPVIAITSIKEAVDYDFASADELVANSDYRIVKGGKNGILYRIAMDWFDVPDCIEVKYRGGYCAAGVTPGTGEIALPDDLREAAILQSTLVFKRKDDIGLSSVGAQGGSASKFTDMELLPMVKDILDNYVRRA
jgi:hypothetical protein